MKTRSNGPLKVLYTQHIKISLVERIRNSRTQPPFIFNISISLLVLVSYRDDSNRDDKKYANSHLLCFLEAKTFKCLPNIIESHHTYMAFGFR